VTRGLTVSADWAVLSPVVAVVAALLLVLLIDALGPRPAPGTSPTGGRAWLLDAVALAGLAASGASVVSLARPGSDAAQAGAATLCRTVDAGLGLPSCAYVASPFTLTVQGLVLAVAIVTLLLALDGRGARDRVAHHVLFLTAVAGVLALAGARDLISLMVAFEMASLPAVGLVALRRDPPGAQGALTLLLTAIGSLGLLALGAGMLLSATGSLYLDQVASVLSGPDLPAAVRAVAALGVLLAVSGVAFKLSAVPFHLWTPDTYAGAPLPVAAFLSVVSKAAGVVALIVLLAIGVPGLADVWAPLVGVMAVVTMTVGNIVALRQRVAVRLLAWSTVAQAGWVLLPLAAAGSRFAVVGGGLGGGSASGTRQAVAASVGYLAAYSAASVTAFAVVVVLSRHVEAAEEHTLEAYRGLARREPVAAAVLGFALLCLAGLPPGVMGLVAKVVAVRPLVDAGSWVFAVVAALNVALGVAYYLRWTALLVAAPATAPGGEVVGVPTWRVRPAEGVALGAGALACVLLSVMPQLIASLVPVLSR
jgi:NADH-quinone oxidoreductase subunit N